MTFETSHWLIVRNHVYHDELRDDAKIGVEGDGNVLVHSRVSKNPHILHRPPTGRYITPRKPPERPWDMLYRYCGHSSCHIYNRRGIAILRQKDIVSLTQLG